MDKIREEFEAWLLGEMEVDISNLRNEDEETNAEWPYDGGDEGTSLTISLAYKAWQASRAALVVELPVKISHQNIDSNGYILPEAKYYDEAIDLCSEKIRAAGITIKGEEK